MTLKSWNLVWRIQDSRANLWHHLSVCFAVRIAHCFCFSGSFLSMAFISHCFHLLILGLSIALPFILFFSPQGSKFMPLMNLPPRGLGNIFMIFLSSVYFGNGEKTGSRSGETLHYFLIITAPFSIKLRAGLRGRWYCLLSNSSLCAHQLHPQVRCLLFPKYPVIRSQHYLPV